MRRRGRGGAGEEEREGWGRWRREGGEGQMVRRGREGAGGEEREGRGRWGGEGRVGQVEKRGRGRADGEERALSPLLFRRVHICTLVLLIAPHPSVKNGYLRKVYLSAVVVHFVLLWRVVYNQQYQLDSGERVCGSTNTAVLSSDSVTFPIQHLNYQHAYGRAAEFIFHGCVHALDLSQYT